MSSYGRAKPYVTRTTPSKMRKRAIEVSRLHQRQFDDYISKPIKRDYTYRYQQFTPVKYFRDKSDLEYRSYWAQRQAEDLQRERSSYLLSQKRSPVVYGPHRPSKPHYRRDDSDGWMHFSDVPFQGAVIEYPPGSKQFYSQRPFVMARIALNKLRAQQRLRASRNRLIAKKRLYNFRKK